MNTPKALKQIGVAAIFVLLLNASLVHSQGATSEQGSGVLKQVADIPMPGPAVRFDYQSLDAKNGRLYIAHMNADQLVVFDTQKRQVVANLDGFKRVHGVIAVPEIKRVFASATDRRGHEHFEDRRHGRPYRLSRRTCILAVDQKGFRLR